MDNPSLAAKYRIRAMPTVLAIANGAVLTFPGTAIDGGAGTDTLSLNDGGADAFVINAADAGTANGTAFAGAIFGLLECDHRFHRGRCR